MVRNMILLLREQLEPQEVVVCSILFRFFVLEVRDSTMIFGLLFGRTTTCLKEASLRYHQASRAFEVVQQFFFCVVPSAWLPQAITSSLLWPSLAAAAAPRLGAGLDIGMTHPTSREFCWNANTFDRVRLNRFAFSATGVKSVWWVEAIKLRQVCRGIIRF